MKSKSKILILGISAIVILVSVQVFVIKDIWFDKEVIFDLKYKLLSQEAMEQFRRMRQADGFESALNLLNDYAKDVMTKEIQKVKDDETLAQLKKEIINDVEKILKELEELSPYLKGYFNRQGFESDFTTKIELNFLQLIDFEKRFDVYTRPDIIPGPPATAANDIKELKSRILVNRFFREDNYYRISFDFYIDFSGKQKIVLHEMSAYLLMSLLSIVIVMVIFFITFHNLMEERRLSNLKTDFINNMTHEIKTPLSTITVAGKTLEMEKISSDPSKIHEIARLIGKQSVHLNQLINLIFEISMWERSQFQLDRKEVDIRELMADIVESFKTANNNNINIIEDYRFDGAQTRIDVVYFTTMINNLLTNAVKYSNKEPLVKINGYTDRENIVISVTDNGIGISKQDQKHIFDKFYRVNYGNIHKIKGLGLGLYYVKRIAEAHGGTVTVSSKLGEGSCFTVTIPK